MVSFSFTKFDEEIRNKNYRPLMMSKRQVTEILVATDPNYALDAPKRFNQIGFYLHSISTGGVSKPLLTLRYVLFDGNGFPYNFDGADITTYDDFLTPLESQAVRINGDDDFCFFLTRTKFHSLFYPLNSVSIPVGFVYPALESTDEDKFVVFMINHQPSLLPFAPKLKLNLYYKLIDAWQGGGGGDSSGPGGTSSNRPPVSVSEQPN